MELLTVQETAALLKVSDGTVRRHVATGRLPAVRVGRLIRIRREAVERFFQPVAPASWESTTADDPLWSIMGIASTDEPTDIARHKDEYITDAIEASWRGGGRGLADCTRDG
jgi:excisionase family DNA binding protein